MGVEKSGCSRFPWKEEVVGSNPIIHTGLQNYYEGEERMRKTRFSMLVRGLVLFLFVATVLLALGTLIGGCSPAGYASPMTTSDVVYFYDTTHGVGCWVLANNSISCIPDDYLTNPTQNFKFDF